MNLQNSWNESESFCFSAKSTCKHHRPSQRSYLDQTLIKTIKQNYYRGNNVCITQKQTQKQNHKNKIGLPPNKRYCLTPLARHNDFNDARIKVKNRNINRASQMTWQSYLSLTHFLCIGLL